ncbi:MAG TPA: hypothetical protein VGQ86_11525 [Candidatus Limnocylindria bacterium]|nr:hypothetical protein [Candidatus Limnocylindria bacterium]
MSAPLRTRGPSRDHAAILVDLRRRLEHLEYDAGLHGTLGVRYLTEPVTAPVRIPVLVIAVSQSRRSIGP